MKTIIAAAFLALAPLAALADATRVAIHVDESDPAHINLVPNNANNIVTNSQGQGQEVEVQIVAYGPGLHMLRADTSPVADRISQIALEHTNVSVQACNNTLQATQSQAGAEIALLSEAGLICGPEMLCTATRLR